jgi:hypothetical protein
MDDTFTAAAAQIAASADAPKKRPPLTEEQKEVLRKRLDVARAKRSALAKAGLLRTKPARKAAKPAPQPVIIAPSNTFTMWSNDEWRDAPYAVALQRLTDLTQDRERGASLVQQKRDSERIPATYNCIVCKKPVQDGRWIWKNDRRDEVTQLYTSDVLCSQICHERFSNNAKFYLDRAKGVS